MIDRLMQYLNEGNLAEFLEFAPEMFVAVGQAIHDAEITYDPSTRSLGTHLNLSWDDPIEIGPGKESETARERRRRHATEATRWFLTRFLQYLPLIISILLKILGAIFGFGASAAVSEPQPA